MRALLALINALQALMAKKLDNLLKHLLVHHVASARLVTPLARLHVRSVHSGPMALHKAQPLRVPGAYLVMLDLTIQSLEPPFV